jgi:hypothetical protein
MNGARYDFEVDSEPERALEIIILRSLARVINSLVHLERRAITKRKLEDEATQLVGLEVPIE